MVQAAEKRARAIHTSKIACARSHIDTNPCASPVVLGHANAKWQEMEAEKHYERDLVSVPLREELRAAVIPPRLDLFAGWLVLAHSMRRPTFTHHPYALLP